MNKINEEFLHWLKYTIDHLEDIKKTALRERDWNEFKVAKTKLDIYKKIAAAAVQVSDQSCEFLLKFIDQEAINISFEKAMQEMKKNYDNIADNIVKYVTIYTIKTKYQKLIEMNNFEKRPI